MMSYPDGRPSPGVISTRGDADAARDKAGKGALAVPSDSFQFEMPADLDQCYERMEEIRTELGLLYAKLYDTKPTGKNGWGETGQPPRQVRDQIQRELDILQYEETQLQMRIMELIWVAPPLDQNADEEEDEREQGDMTQPEIFMQLGANGTMTIGWPDIAAETDDKTGETPAVAAKPQPQNRQAMQAKSSL